MFDRLFSQKSAEIASSLLVLICSGLAGHYAALGMSQVQIVGAATAILGSVMAAVMVRLWPQGEKIPIRLRKDD